MSPRRPTVRGDDRPWVTTGAVVYEGANGIERGILTELNGPLWMRELTLALYHAGCAGLTAEEFFAFIKSVFAKVGVE